MKHRYVYLETAVLSVVAIALSVTIALPLPFNLLNAIYPTSSWAERGDVLRCLIAIYSAGIFILATGSFIMIRYRNQTLSVYCFTFIRSTMNEISTTCKWFHTTGQMRGTASWLTFITVIGAAVRSFFLAQPMRYDEAYTFLNFVNGSLHNLFYYPLPNNHVLHTLLVRMSVELFGYHPVAIRLPAVLAGILAIPLIFCLSRLLNGNGRNGFLAAALVVVYPYLILYDTMARGYSLVVLLSLCLIGLGVRVIKYPSKQLCLVMAFVIALGMLDMPSFLFPSAGVLFWVAMMLMQRGCKPFWVLNHVLIPCILMVSVITGLFYTPVVIMSNGINSLINNRFVMSLPWQEFLTRLPEHLSSTATQFVRDVPNPLLIASYVLLAVGLYANARQKRWITFMLPPAILIGSAIVLITKHSFPYARTWIFLLPLIFIMIDAGLSTVVNFSNIYIKRILLFLVLSSAIVIMNRDMISSYPDTGQFPEASALVDVLLFEMSPADQLRVRVPADIPMRFYMWYKNVPRKGFPTHASAIGRVFYVVKGTRYSLADMTKDPVRNLLRIGDAELYVAELPQTNQ